ncbi:class I SAM-dependent methyltransferase [Paludisphaera soli]|uniref:class I SAM-dependent methyltransferase n=1 Tax=Paludisphaera soli TaxID=2712865 RepID=UPI0013E9B974|nr:class I SAM-dependent methyltransferase [Paludisphaera soli]
MTSTSDEVFRYRAVRSRGVSLEEDPEPMIQQQLARLKFFERTVGTEGRSVLDWGCGTGYNCAWLATTGRAREAVGFDVSADSIAIAAEAAPEVEFLVADSCDPDLHIRPGRWDRILSCEVLEHVPDMPEFLANMRRHLAPDGVAFVSTPNRQVFSLGHEPSPMNKEHIKELQLDEFHELVGRYFSDVTIYGQQFRDDALLEAWKDDVRAKIAKLAEGTRWKEARASRLKRIPLLERLHRVGPLRAAWRQARWRAWPAITSRLRPATPGYMHGDFEFVTGDLTRSLWLCAVLRP